MKILFYIHSLHVGGAETIVTDYLLSLKSHGVEVALTVNHHEDSFLEKKLNAAKIKIYTLGTAMPRSRLKKFIWHIKLRLVNYRKKFDKIIELEHPDLIHTHMSIARLYGGKFPINRTIYSFHSNVERALRLGKKREYDILSKLSQQGLVFFALTDQMRSDIRRIFNTDRIYKLPNAVDIQKIRANAYTKNEFLPQIGVPSDAFVLGHVGRFNVVKNHERIISIFNELHKLRKDSYLVLVGGDDCDRISKLKKLVGGYGIEEYVKFLGMRQDATRIMGCFDAFVLPSFSEAFSLVLIETQALNIRAAASDNVPIEVFCNDNCFHLSLEKADEQWAKLLISDSVSDSKKSIEDFDIGNATKMLIENYKTVIGGSLND